jgi:hypothetical protein
VGENKQKNVFEGLQTAFFRDTCPKFVTLVVEVSDTFLGRVPFLGHVEPTNPTRVRANCVGFAGHATRRGFRTYPVT